MSIGPRYSEARRQIEICNACRYCEGYCDVFPAIHRARSFADADITQLANLCHNCRGCYYACQYVAPHEFALNLPGILAETRSESWEAMIWPRGAVRLFQRHGMAVAAALVAGLAAILWLIRSVTPVGGEGFYAHMSHALMVAVFLPAFLLPLVVMGFGLRRYLVEVGAKPLRFAHLRDALANAGRLKNLSGGQGQGCNFEDEDRYSNLRRGLHQATAYGFLLCFAATSAGTVLHYGFGQPAPYGLFSLPKLLGVPGGVLLTAGTAGLAALKLRGARDLGDTRVWGGEMAFVLLLLFVALSGLVLFAAAGTGMTGPLLALHLGGVLAFFLLMPYSKMVHALFRFAALLVDAQRR